MAAMAENRGDGTAQTARVREFVERARGGDEGAFTCLVEQSRPGLARFCRRLMADASAQQDLEQETLLRAYQALPRLQDPTRFDAWLFGIAANLARRWWRRQARRPVSLDWLAATHPDLPLAPWGEVLPEPVLPDQLVEEAEQARRLLDAVAALPASLRQVVVLHYLENLSYAEVAGALDVPISLVRRRLFKSRAQLRLALASDGAETARPRGSGARRSRSYHNSKGEPTAMATPERGERGEQPDKQAKNSRQKAREAMVARLKQAWAGQAVRQPPRRPQPHWRIKPSGMVLHGFSDPARQALAFTEDEPKRFNHNYIGTEHQLLGLLREEAGTAARVLTGLGVTLDAVRGDVEFIIGRGAQPVTVDYGLTPRAIKVLDLAVEESRLLNHDYLGTEHLLLGLVREGEGIGAGILVDLCGTDLERVRTETLAALTNSGEAPGGAAA
jgi:RNA polymerase sigma factor (sigma-70 family)